MSMDWLLLANFSMLAIYVFAKVEIKVYKLATVQLKGNLMPARVLQVEYCRVKITSCV